MRTSFAAIVAAATLGLAATAEAGNYVGLAIGGSPVLDGPYTEGDRKGTGKNGRLLVGHRFGRLSLEAAVSAYSFANHNAGYDVRTISGGGKLNVPVRGKLEVLARLGAERSWLSGTEARLDPAQADGFYAGVGAEYPLDLGLGRGSVFVDLTQHEGDTENDLRLSVTRWSVGVTIGF